jgi:hypothetical protein
MDNQVNYKGKGFLFLSVIMHENEINTYLQRNNGWHQQEVQEHDNTELQPVCK